MAETIRLSSLYPTFIPRKKVAAYARVSTDEEDQLKSLSEQVDYFDRLIRRNPEWRYAGVFVDQGITGTRADIREGFNRLIKECEAGNVDIILVKSISRFARNTVDTLQTIRHLKEIGVEVRFERERINTFTGEGELMLTILASYAQEESRSISANTKWGIRKRFEQGIPNGHKAPYGYTWDGERFRQIPDQAETVKLIFDLYLKGQTPFQIRDELNRQGIPSPTGTHFTDSTIKQMLSNISYTGTMMLQKTFTTDPHKRVTNRGQLDRYLLDGMFEPVITEEEYNTAQEIRQERASAVKESHLTCFSGRMKCGCCGRSMSRRTAAGKKKWVCNAKERKHTCSLRDISEDELMELTASVVGDGPFKSMVDMVTVFDDKVEFKTSKGYTAIRKRSYEGKKRGGFSGRLFCGYCGSPVQRQKARTWFFRQCAGERKHECSMRRLKDKELMKACKRILNRKEGIETEFAGKVRKLVIYDDRLEFFMKNKEVKTWNRQ